MLLLLLGSMDRTIQRLIFVFLGKKFKKTNSVGFLHKKIQNYKEICLPPVLDPEAVPGKPAPLIPVMGRLTPSAIPVIGLPPAVPFLAVPILPAPIFV